MALDIKKFIGRFVEEAKDHLGRMGHGLSALEQGSASVEDINSLFRSVHTLKGSSRMLKLEPITQLAHSLEDVLSALRDQQLQVSHSLISALYQGVDVLSDQVAQLAEHGEVAENPALPHLCQQLSGLAQGQVPQPEHAPRAEASRPVIEPDVEQLTPTLAASDTIRVKLTK